LLLLLLLLLLLQVALTLAHRRIQELKLKNVEIRLDDLQNVSSDWKFDVGLALHACGMLTDVVLERCLHIKASFVLVGSHFLSCLSFSELFLFSTF
jgi:hypothetical protein